ncbi:hypothetical protein HZS_1091, partial [Henneguya salminicola]
MSESKKIFEDAVKNIKIVFNEINKSFDGSTEILKQMMNELVEYSRRRAEIESEYSRSMLKLSERMNEKNEKFNSSFKALGKSSDKQCSLLVINKSIEKETKSRADQASKFSDFFLNILQTTILGFLEFQICKTQKCKEFISVIFEKFNENVAKSYESREKYVEAVNFEEKSCKTYVRKMSKTGKKHSEAKIEKAYLSYMNDILRTDRQKNNYVLSYYSTLSCFESFSNQILSELVMLFDYKFAEFGNTIKTELCKILDENKENINKLIQRYNDILCSDAYESDLTLSRFNKKMLEEIDIWFSLSFHPRDTYKQCVFSGDLKKSYQQELDTLNEKVVEKVQKLNNCVTAINIDKEIEFDWIIVLSEEKHKNSKTKCSPIFERCQNYFTNAKNYLLEELHFRYLKTYYATLAKEFELSKSIDRIPINMIELKKCMTFGVNLKEHCKTFNVSLPIPLTILVKYLTDDELIKREGIFRLSATKTNLALIKEHLEKTGRIDFDACPLVVATLIKQYIRKLSGFIETSLFDAFRKVAGKINKYSIAKPSSEFNEAAKELVDTLDENTKTLLIYLAHFIKYISLYYESNKMDLKNLSIVFGPTIFSCDDPSALDSQEILNYFIASFCEAIEEIYPNDNLFNEQSFSKIFLELFFSDTYDEDRKDSIPEERSGLY